MTISSSLNAGVAGLNANATRLATISDNIANSGTYGYKRATADFASMVISGSSSGKYAAGGVRTTTQRLVDEAGTLISTSNPTDIAIDGRGFLPVTALTSAASGGTDMMLTTTGSFRADENGYLTTSTGLVLLGWPADANGNIPSYPRDTTAGLEPVRITANQYAGNPTTEMRLAINLPATSTVAGASGGVESGSFEYYGNLGTSETLGVTFTPTVPASGASNQWTMQITDSASGSVVGEYVLAFDASQASGGTLASVTTVSGGAYDPAAGSVTLTLGGGPMTLVIGQPGTNSGMTQLSDIFAPSATKNGSTVGSLVSVEVDANGKLNAIYDNGVSRTIYGIPVVDVANPNGLTAAGNQTWRISADSGAFLLWDAGQGPTGEMAGYSRQESTTDVASELTSLIQTQRAYASNAKVIQTVDEMLQETTNIKR